MVKPAMPYLDIIADAARLTPDHPLACYQVSGEYAMVVAGAEKGIYDLQTMAFESVQGMVRAGRFVPYLFAAGVAQSIHFIGATLILSYFTPQFLDWLES